MELEEWRQHVQASVFTLSLLNQMDSDNSDRGWKRLRYDGIFALWKKSHRRCLTYHLQLRATQLDRRPRPVRTAETVAIATSPSVANKHLGSKLVPSTYSDLVDSNCRAKPPAKCRRTRLI